MATTTKPINIDPAILEKLKPGAPVYTVLRHVSQAGMSRDIDLYVMGTDGPIKITYIAKDLLKLRWGKREGVRIGGCGMDLGFALVYDLSSMLYPAGYPCAGKNCHSNDHFKGDRDYTEHDHHDGGNALRQCWM